MNNITQKQRKQVIIFILSFIILIVSITLLCTHVSCSQDGITLIKKEHAGIDGCAPQYYLQFKAKNDIIVDNLILKGNANAEAYILNKRIHNDYYKNEYIKIIVSVYSGKDIDIGTSNELQIHITYIQSHKTDILKYKLY